jgi:signal transduction histidine kinase
MAIVSTHARTATDERQSELRGKLWFAFVLQIVAISAATLLSVYGAWIVLRDVLIQRALADESAHYWQRLERDPAAQLPDTYNMHGFLAPRAGGAEVPPELAALAPGYHSVRTGGRDNLVFVDDGAAGRPYLVFEQEQVDRLALWFGFIPLSVVLLMIYVTTWLTYRVSRRAVSPVIWLANQVRGWDPKRPDFEALQPDSLPPDAGGDVQVLAGALHGFATRLEEFVERERNFTRDASHELRSPLTVIKIAADVLLDDEELTPFGTRSVTRIKRAAREMESLMEALLILAREGDVGLPEEDFVVNDAITEEIARARELLGDKPVRLTLVEDGHFALHAPLRVFLVMVSNLLRNACTYTDAGSITVTVGRDHVSVADTGPGIAPEDLERVFQPFYRAKGSREGGHGIGLTIVKRLSDRFGWPVELRSKPGEGTTAVVRFPNPQPV